MTDELIDKIFASVDVNHDAVVSKDEFPLLFKHFREAVLLPPVAETEESKE